MDTITNIWYHSVTVSRVPVIAIYLWLTVVYVWNALFVTQYLRYAPVILSRFGRYVVPTLLTPTFRRNWCWFRLGATLCHDVLCCCHAVATPGPRYYPVLTSDTGKFSYVVLRYVSLLPRCNLAAATLSYTVPRNMTKHSVSPRIRNVT